MVRLTEPELPRDGGRQPSMERERARCRGRRGLHIEAGEPDDARAQLEHAPASPAPRTTWCSWSGRVRRPPVWRPPAGAARAPSPLPGRGEACPTRSELRSLLAMATSRRATDCAARRPGSRRVPGGERRGEHADRSRALRYRAPCRSQANRLAAAKRCPRSVAERRRWQPPTAWRAPSSPLPSCGAVGCRRSRCPPRHRPLPRSAVPAAVGGVAGEAPSNGR